MEREHDRCCQSRIVGGGNGKLEFSPVALIAKAQTVSTRRRRHDQLAGLITAAVSQEKLNDLGVRIETHVVRRVGPEMSAISQFHKSHLHPGRAAKPGRARDRVGE